MKRLIKMTLCMLPVVSMAMPMVHAHCEFGQNCQFGKNEGSAVYAGVGAGAYTCHLVSAPQNPNDWLVFKGNPGSAMGSRVFKIANFKQKYNNTYSFQYTPQPASKNEIDISIIPAAPDDDYEGVVVCEP